MIEFNDLKLFEASGARRLGPLTLALDPAARTALVGPSGSGKTLLIRALFGALPRGFSEVGQIRAFGQPLGPDRPRDLRRRMAWMPQAVDTALNPHLSLSEHLTLLPASLLDEPPGLALERLQPLLEDLGLPGTAAFLKRKPPTLSGGQRQRLLLAMALSCQPDLLVLDEPTTGLDPIRQEDLANLLEGLRADHGMGWLWVTHDLALAARVSDRLAVLDTGRLVAAGPTAGLLAAPEGEALVRLVEAARARA